CPACLHQFTVRKPAPGAVAAPPPKKNTEIDLSPMHDDEETPLPEDVPGMVAPKRASGPAVPPVRPPAVPPPSPAAKAPVDLSDELDLPAPKAKVGALGRASKPPPVPIVNEPTNDDAALKIAAPPQ